MSQNKLSWYWHRLRAMTPLEMALHARKKWRQARDAERGERYFFGDESLVCSEVYPKLPLPSRTPRSLETALSRDVDEILAGHWRAFGHLPIQVDDPPRWQKDYLANIDLARNESAFKLNHRTLPKGADVKLIWELSRWYQIVRLAMASYALKHERAAQKCITWLEDWVVNNPPFRGWNWTSALETGMRLIQFTWIDALLSENAREWQLETELNRLRDAILPAHTWYTWRHKSFGSSANNHLMGELAGLIVATVRWPGLAKWGASLNLLQPMWERETLRQFCEDGGTREQALSYQLFSFEFCWYVRSALLAAGRNVSHAVERRLGAAAAFFSSVETDHEQWDYGDGDNGYILPVSATDASRVAEWRRWASHGEASQGESPALEFWLRPCSFILRKEDVIPRRALGHSAFFVFPESGIAVAESGFWRFRWDLSPLGYLATAAHGHLDALHLSVWYKGIAFVVDPGTGAYFADVPLRTWLASREAHNGPCPAGPQFPMRLGPFLWSAHHAKPEMEDDTARLNLPEVQLRRKIVASPAELEWTVEDSATRSNGAVAEFSVRWQFAPGTWIRRTDERTFVLNRQEVSITVKVSEGWDAVLLVENEDQARDGASAMEQEYAGTVSPAFRKVEWAPYLKLIARPKGGQSCVFRTTFIVSAAS